jgi:hypothetical protein
MKGSHPLWDIPIGQRFVCEYNSTWQAIGMSAMKFRRMTGSIVKSGNFVRMRDDWSQVTQHMKEDMWDALMI